MIPLSDGYQRSGGGVPLGGILPVTTGDVISSSFAEGQSEDFNATLGAALSDQDAALSKSGIKLPTAGAVVNAMTQARGGNAGAQHLLDLYNSGISDAKIAHPDVPFYSTEELSQSAADKNRRAKEAASEIESRATTGQSLVGGAIGGMGAQLTDPAQLAMLMAFPVSAESFGGNLLLRLGKSALSQAAIQGGTALASTSQYDSFYRLEGMSDDEINAQRWRNAGSAAAGGAALTPIMEVGGMALGKAFSWLTKGSLAERQAAIDAFQKSGVDLGTDATADLANHSEALHYEAQNPFPPSVESNRAFASNLDNISDAIKSGDPGEYVFGARQFDYAPPRSDASGIALRNAELGYHLPEDVAAELGVKRPGPVSHEEINASLQKKMADGMVSAAQDDSTHAASRISDIEEKLADLQQEHDAYAPEAGKALPNADALEKGGLDPNTANVLHDIEQQLDGKLTKKARTALEAQREAIVQSVPNDIAAAKQGLADHVADLKSQIADATRESGLAQRAKATADAEVARVAKIADQADRKLNNLREAKAPAEVAPAPITDGPAQPARSPLAAMRDQRAEMRRPMEPDEVKAAVQTGEDVAAGKYDSAIVDEARTALEAGDMTLGEGNDRYSVKERLNELDEHEAALSEVLACMTGG